MDLVVNHVIVIQKDLLIQNVTQTWTSVDDVNVKLGVEAGAAMNVKMVIMVILKLITVEVIEIKMQFLRLNF